MLGDLPSVVDRGIRLSADRNTLSETPFESLLHGPERLPIALPDRAALPP